MPGYLVQAWLVDIKTRLARVTLAAKKEELALLEKKLKKILPAEVSHQDV